jgi:site-specific DNA recombinase
VGEYVDNSMSASSKTTVRPRYDEMVADFAAGVFDALICWDLDRLTRQPRQLEDWVDAAEERGLLLVTANGEADLSTDGGRMFARIKIAVARAEIERKSARRRSANAQRAENGVPNSGAQLTGYRTRKGVTKVVPAEADVIGKVFRRFAAGDSIRSLVQWLNSPEGLPTRFGRPWIPSTVRGILTNPKYAGRMVYQGQVVPAAGKWEAIVEDDLFDAVQEKLADPRRRKQTGTDRKYLGSGLYLCGICDKPVTGGPRYQCRDAHSTRSQGPVDAYVEAVIRERLGRPDLIDLLPVEQDDQAKRAGAELARIRRRLETIEADYDRGDIDGRRYAIATEKAAAELSKAQAASARSGASRSLALLMSDDPVQAYDDAPLMLKRAMLDLLCTVRLYPAPRGRKAFDPDTVIVTPKEQP